MSRWLFVFLFISPLYFLGPECGALKVGTMDIARGGEGSFSEGGFFDKARAAAYEVQSDVGLVGLTTLDSPGLMQCDLLILSSVMEEHRRIDPLTTSERESLRAYVLSGGNVLLLLDNDDFLGTGLEEVVGITSAGHLAPPATAVLGDLSHPIASGPFGAPTDFSQAYAGYLSSYPGPTRVLARNELGPAFAEIPAGTFGDGSGLVIIVTDNQTFADEGSMVGADFEANAVLWKNLLHYVFIGKPVGLSSTTMGMLKGRW